MIILTYIVVAVLYTSIRLYLAINSLKKDKLDKFIALSAFISSAKEALSTGIGTTLKKKYWNWYMISFMYIPLFIIISQFVFPFSLLSIARKLLFGKNDIEKMDESYQRSQEFMRNEGCENNFK